MTRPTRPEPLDAWTPRALASAIGVAEEIVERVLDQSVAEGTVVRLTSGVDTLYVEGSLSKRLDDLGAVPVVGARHDTLRSVARRIRLRHRIDGLDR